MKLVIKGISCEVSYDFIMKVGGFQGYTGYIEKRKEIESRSDIAFPEVEGEFYDIVKLLVVKEEVLIKELYDYPVKPSAGDMLGIDGEEIEVMRVTCWEDGSIVCVTSKVVDEVINGLSLKEARSLAETTSKGMGFGNVSEIKKSSSYKKVLDLFRGSKDCEH